MRLYTLTAEGCSSCPSWLLPTSNADGYRICFHLAFNNQVSSFNLTHLARVAQIVSEYLTALPPLCEVSLLGVPRYTALFSYWLLMLAYWLLVDTGGFEPHLSLCKSDAFPIKLPTHIRGRRRVFNLTLDTLHISYLLDYKSSALTIWLFATIRKLGFEPKHTV